MYSALVQQQAAQRAAHEELARSLDQEFWGVHTEVIKSTHGVEVRGPLLARTLPGRAGACSLAACAPGLGVGGRASSRVGWGGLFLEHRALGCLHTGRAQRLLQR
jgi:hypothetical protein